mmetsp:Transcript_24947/g.70242  ORF Transcript_24947/g.70242 Transcript_24947/m.70242 type:complete len:216 (+) Transcript_24947:272-919(+)
MLTGPSALISLGARHGGLHRPCAHVDRAGRVVHHRELGGVGVGPGGVDDEGPRGRGCGSGGFEVVRRHAGHHRGPRVFVLPGGRRAVGIEAVLQELPGCVLVPVRHQCLGVHRLGGWRGRHPRLLLLPPAALLAGLGATGRRFRHGAGVADPQRVAVRSDVVGQDDQVAEQPAQQLLDLLGIVLAGGPCISEAATAPSHRGRPIFGMCLVLRDAL